jgi:hypothetical protein
MYGGEPVRVRSKGWAAPVTDHPSKPRHPDLSASWAAPSIRSTHGHLRMAEELAEALDIEPRSASSRPATRPIAASPGPHRTIGWRWRAGPWRQSPLRWMTGKSTGPDPATAWRPWLRARRTARRHAPGAVHGQRCLPGPHHLASSGADCSTWPTSPSPTAPASHPTLWEDALPDELRRSWPSACASSPASWRSPRRPVVFPHAITQLDISASQIRDRCLRGKSLRYLLPDCPHRLHPRESPLCLNRDTSPSNSPPNN